MTSSFIRATAAAAAIVGAALVLTSCGSPEIVAGPSTMAPVAEQPSVGVSAAPSSVAPTPDVDAAQAAWERLDAAIDAGDVATAAKLTAPGSAAAIYANTAASMIFSNPELSTVGRVDANGVPVKLGGPINVDPAGLITDLTRNGIPVSKLIAGPSGEALTATPATVEFADFTGEVTATVTGYRWFDGNLQVVFDVKNDTNKNAQLDGSSFVSGGRQYDVVYNSTFAAPGVTRTMGLVIKNIPVGQGGTLTAKVSSGYSGTDQTITVPSLAQQ